MLLSREDLRASVTLWPCFSVRGSMSLWLGDSVAICLRDLSGSAREAEEADAESGEHASALAARVMTRLFRHTPALARRSPAHERHVETTDVAFAEAPGFAHLLQPCLRLGRRAHERERQRELPVDVLSGPATGSQRTTRAVS